MIRIKQAENEEMFRRLDDVSDASRLVKDIGTEGVGRLIDDEMVYYPPSRIEEITVSQVPE